MLMVNGICYMYEISYNPARLHAMQALCWKSSRMPPMLVAVGKPAKAAQVSSYAT